MSEQIEHVAESWKNAVRTTLGHMQAIMKLGDEPIPSDERAKWWEGYLQAREERPVYTDEINNDTAILVAWLSANRPNINTQPIQDVRTMMADWTRCVDTFRDSQTLYALFDKLATLGEQASIVLAAVSDVEPAKQPQAPTQETRVGLTIIAGKSAGVEPATQAQETAEARHSPDFRSVHWYGDSYSFTPNQAKAVQELWKAWEAETPDLGNAFLLESIESDNPKIANTFRGNSAWGTMIVDGSTKGTYRLASP